MPLMNGKFYYFKCIDNNRDFSLLYVNFLLNFLSLCTKLTSGREHLMVTFIKSFKVAQ